MSEQTLFKNFSGINAQEFSAFFPKKLLKMTFIQYPGKKNQKYYDEAYDNFRKMTITTRRDAMSYRSNSTRIFGKTNTEEVLQNILMELLINFLENKSQRN